MSQLGAPILCDKSTALSLRTSQGLIYTGNIFHARRGGIEHSFRYPLNLFLVDLDHLHDIAQSTKFFSYNRWNIYSIHDSDYVDQSLGSIQFKLHKYLLKKNIERPHKIKLLTSPRYLGYIFNPVSFYYCYNGEMQIYCVLAEVNNTFHERHLYILDRLEYHPNSASYTARAPKEFYVSPFYEVTGNYAFRFSEPGASIDLRVNKYHAHTHNRENLVGVTVLNQVSEEQSTLNYEFISLFRGNAHQLNQQHLFRILLQSPLNSWMAMPRIMYEAARLYYLKKAPIVRKPLPMSPMTIRVAPLSKAEQLARNIFFRYLKPLQKGKLTIHCPDKTTIEFGGLLPGPQACMQIHHPRFFTHLIRHGNVGLGETFTRSDWDADDVTALLKIICINSDQMEHTSIMWTWLGEVTHRLSHWSRRNSLKNARQNIHEHYDLSNDFFATFLDPTMAYSCALFDSPEQQLQQAQLNKIHRLLKQARLKPEHHLLEIGCGWGRLAIEAARTYGCRVTGITLSEEQLKYTQHKVDEAGLNSQIDIKLCDYRNLTGKYDRIISVEMLEAVGHEFLGTYFQKLDALLNTQGLAVMQSITIADQFYDTYRKSCDWIQKHIFPGGHLPSLTAISNSLTKNTSFVMHNMTDYAQHYAETLRRWRATFNEQLSTIEELGFDQEFIRKWNYYLMYCEAGFDTQRLGLVQFTLKRNSEPTITEISP